MENTNLSKVNLECYLNNSDYYFTFNCGEVEVYHFQHTIWERGITAIVYKDKLVGHLVWQACGTNAYYVKGYGNIVCETLKRFNRIIDYEDTVWIDDMEPRERYSQDNEIMQRFKEYKQRNN